MIFSTALAFIWAPFLIRLLYKYKLWRKKSRIAAIKTNSVDAEVSAGLTQLAQKRQFDTNVPRLGGLLIFLTTIFTAFLFAFLAKISDNFWLNKFNFLSRDQTWVPLAVLVAASFIGLADDLVQIFEKGKGHHKGLKFTRRLLGVFIIAIIAASWFYFKLEAHTLYVPGIGDVDIGPWYLLLFVLVVLACWSGGIIDGLDGLAGGIFAIIFTSFSIIAFSQHQYNVAALCAVIAGTTLTFLWFNIPPARFYMGEVGVMGLTCTLAVISFITNSVLLLPIIAGILVIGSGSVILQILSYKIFKKRLFLCTPIHHHFELKGWLPEKITMRFWILGLIFAIIGTIIGLLK